MSVDPKADYYDAGGIETIEYIKAKLTHCEFIGYIKGTALKYLSRASFKDDENRDLEKAETYLRILNSYLKELDEGPSKISDEIPAPQAPSIPRMDPVMD